MVHIDPFVDGRAFDPADYDFGLAFDGVFPDLSARYRLVSVGEALVIAGIPGPSNPPANPVQTGGETQTRTESKGQ